MQLNRKTTNHLEHRRDLSCDYWQRRFVQYLHPKSETRVSTRGFPSNFADAVSCIICAHCGDMPFGELVTACSSARGVVWMDDVRGHAKQIEFFLCTTVLVQYVPDPRWLQSITSTGRLCSSEKANSRCMESDRTVSWQSFPWLAQVPSPIQIM